MINISTQIEFTDKGEIVERISEIQKGLYKCLWQNVKN